MKTATSETVMDTIVNPISREPFKAASIAPSPSSMRRTMFSSITTASSDRNEDSYQRDRHGYDRKSDFSRAFQGRFHRAFPFFHAAHDVLKHHHGIVRSE